jgi:multiple sugar transport system ATP-binding protein
VEAMTLGDRVAVMRDGLIQQVAKPTELFNNPANLFVAAFIGSPSMNLVEATVRGTRVSFGEHVLPVPSSFETSGQDERRVILGLRPSDFEDAGVWPSDLPVIDVTADMTEELGSECHVIFAVAAPALELLDTAAAAQATEGEELDLSPLVVEEGKTVFTARVDARTGARPGSRVRLSIDPERLHFFDRETGVALASARTAGASA